MIEILPFDKKMTDDWEAVITSVRSGNFLYSRRYIDYHGDKFHDKSLLVRKNNKVIAAFPAAMVGNDVISHPGITFGGLISTSSLHGEEALLVMKNIKDHYKEEGAEQLIYKALPFIFYDYPCQEDLYALNVMGATLFRRDLSSVIKMSTKKKFSKGRVWSINKSIKLGVKITETLELKQFYRLLLEVLKNHNAIPTHSLLELQDLFTRFPKNISLFGAVINNEMLAGAIVYDYGDVVHTQYLASSDEGKKMGCLDHLISYLINDRFNDKKYFSFGISTEDDGKILNNGLISFKESFGARGITNDFYRLNL